MGDYEIRALTSETWPAYAALIEKHNGIFGGCWDTYFHSLARDPERTYDSNRALKCRLVEEGRAHAAVVFDGEAAVGWCQYGSPEELPNIHHRKQYLEEADVLPDYRLTCIFVDRDHRRQGVTEVAIRGALDMIASAGGGVVEGYPHEKPTQEGLVVVPLQRHPTGLRADGLRVRPPEGPEELRHEDDGRPSLGRSLQPS